MPTGIDVGARTLVVATPDGTTRHRNELRRTADEDDGITVESDDGSYAVGGEPDDDTTDDEPPPRLLGGTTDRSAEVRRAAVEAFLTAILDDEGDRLRYVATDRPTGDLLAEMATELGHDAAPLDPGMAVLYDGLDAPATGLGVVIGEEAAVATLAVAGVPVATARTARDGGLPGSDHASPATDDRDPSAPLAVLHYEPLLARLAADIAATAPSLADPVPVVIGGLCAPSETTDGFVDALTDPVPFGIESVMIADSPVEAVARGALVAAEADDGTPAVVPTYGVDVPTTAALADTEAAATALGTGVARPTGTTTGLAAGDGDGTGPGSSTALAAASGGTAGDDSESVDELISRTRRELAVLEREGATTARALAAFIAEIEAAGVDAERLERLRSDLDALEAAFAGSEGFDDLGAEVVTVRETVTDLADEIDRLDEVAATSGTVTELDESLAELSAAVEDLESDTDTLRAVLTGIDDETVTLDAPEFEGAGVDALRADAIRDHLDGLETRLDEELGHVWDELDETDDELVDLRATVRDVPELEEQLDATRDDLTDLGDDLEGVQDALSGLRDQLATIDSRSATSADIREVTADIERVEADLDSLREAFEGTERVDPQVVEQLRTDVDGLRQTFIERAERLESLEGEVGDLEERIETVYQNSAKAEALASLQTEVSRIRQTAARGIETSTELEETVSGLSETVEKTREEVDSLSANVDSLAGNAVTRPEMKSTVGDLEERLGELADELESVRETARETPDVEPSVVPETSDPDIAIASLAAGLVGLGLFGAVFAALQNSLLVAAGFLVVGGLTGSLAWFVD